MTISQTESYAALSLFDTHPTCISYGWILSEEKVQLGEEKAGFPLISVYYPNVPTLVTGSGFRS